MYAVIKDSKVISYLIHEDQIAFLAEQDPGMSFIFIDHKWNAETPPMLSEFSVQPDGSIMFNGQRFPKE